MRVLIQRAFFRARFKIPPLLRMRARVMQRFPVREKRQTNRAAVHYWWLSAGASGECMVLRWNVRVDGGVLRAYLWMQIIAGWLLSAIFIAG